MESFMKMTSAKSHRELKDEGILIEFKETLGHAMCLGFVQFGDFLRISKPKGKSTTNFTTTMWDNIVWFTCSFRIVASRLIWGLCLINGQALIIQIHNFNNFLSFNKCCVSFWRQICLSIPTSWLEWCWVITNASFHKSGEKNLCWFGMTIFPSLSWKCATRVWLQQICRMRWIAFLLTLSTSAGRKSAKL